MNRADWYAKKYQAFILAVAGLMILVGIIHWSNLGPPVAKASFSPSVARDEGEAPGIPYLLDEQYCEDENTSGFSIPFNTLKHSDIHISCAPAGATVSRVAVRAEFDHNCTQQLNIRLEKSGPPIHSTFLQQCEETEGGSQILEFSTDHFNGDTVNDTWTLYLRDCHDGCLGYFNSWGITVYYVVPTATPTPTQSPAPPTPTGLDLRIEHVELTQAIQCKDNSHCPDNAVPLISGKDTYVRVYVEVLGSSASVPNVTARVTAKMPWGDYTTDPINATITAKLSPQRSKFNDTLNFHLPASMVDASGTLSVEINQGRTIAETDYTNNQKTLNLTFVTTPPLIIVPIWIDYDFGGTQAIVDGSMHYNMGYYLKNILPVGQIQWHILPGPTLKWTQQIGPGGGSWGSILAKLTDMRKKNASVPASAHWYAMVPFKVAQGGMCGLACMPGKVAAGRVPVHHENFEDAADIMAHELGHNFNRAHSPCGVTPSDPNYPYPNARLGDYGWDPQVAGGGKVQSWPGGYVVPATSFDVMSYCQDEWISEYTYRAILNYRGTSPTAAKFEAKHQMFVALGEQHQLSEERRPYLFASGTIGEDRAELDPWAILERAMGSDDGSGEGPYRLQLIAENEEILFERHFSTEMLQETWLPGTWVGGMEEDGRPAFYEILPWHPDTAQIQVWDGERLLAERDVSDHPPAVEVIAPREGDFWPSAGEGIIEWRAEDGDGDPLWFDVSFSRDGGETWDVIATRLEENHLSVRGDQFPGTEGAMLRICASDGVLTSDAISGPFTVEPKRPRVSISVPMDGVVAPVRIPLRLRGYAYDPEDGVLSDGGMEWDSDRDGWLGHGSDLLVEGLSRGWHTITLHAADGDEQIGSDSVSILVGNRIYLPLVTKG